MKRDMDFIREMLLWMEERDDRIFYQLQGFPGLDANEEKIFGHLALLISAGFVDKPKEH
ncbi:hypothetical protein [Erythrobacter rubeus]|uniref:DUF2513 domain-containing protein n=1 Tax=Erythrobacter rubeus TaxID=2760803 RepID=A0ABR8KSW6_9SPHN|nr:hypothetical protein [Erythrobacter rubeus]MBD2841316.1 hypothetical protein [Erythrobacter rubeus]